MNDACNFANGGRNMATRFLGDRTAVYNSRIYGCHDTVYTGTHRVYFKDSLINGSTDFLFGEGSAVWDNCTIVGNGGHITAHRGMITDRNLNTCAPNKSCTAYLIRNSR